ncbi:MAG TPA: hypothetical protein VLG27_05185 [Candidatus Saccharimonadia bacterium]|nr:hypothetical protein [Candidatus Saccharimonadia bacterium]
MSDKKLQNESGSKETVVLDVLPIDDYRQFIEDTKERLIEVTDLHGNRITGYNRGFFSYNRGTTILSDSVMLEQVERSDDFQTDDGQATGSTERAARIPANTVSKLLLAGGKVIDMPQHSSS